MASTFSLVIVSPYRQFFKGEAQELVFSALDGQHGILPMHEPMVTTLRAGELKFKVDGEWKYAACSDGFVEVMPTYVVMLADTVEWPEEIDLNRAEAAKERAEERMRQNQSQHEYYQAQAALSRAMARLKIGRHNY